MLMVSVRTGGVLYLAVKVLVFLLACLELYGRMASITDLAGGVYMRW